MEVPVHHSLWLGLVARREAGEGLRQQLLLFIAQGQLQVMSQQPLGEDGIFAGHEGLIEGLELERHGAEPWQQGDGLAIPGQYARFVQAADKLGIPQVRHRQQSLLVVDPLYLGGQQPRIVQGGGIANEFMIFFGFRISIHPHQTAAPEVAAETGVTGNKRQREVGVTGNPASRLQKAGKRDRA